MKRVNIATAQFEHDPSKRLLGRRDRRL